jgi:predicted transcriptional regulator
MLAKELTTKHQLKQAEIAKLLGVSQPAISLYSRKMRGKAICLENQDEIEKLVKNLADRMAKRELSSKEFIVIFCEICKAIRAKGLLCELHKALDPSFDVDKCELCLTVSKISCLRESLNGSG